MYVVHPGRNLRTPCSKRRSSSDALRHRRPRPLSPRLEERRHLERLAHRRRRALVELVDDPELLARRGGGSGSSGVCLVRGEHDRAAKEVECDLERAGPSKAGGQIWSEPTGEEEAAGSAPCRRPPRPSCSGGTATPSPWPPGTRPGGAAAARPRSAGVRTAGRASAAGQGSVRGKDDRAPRS